MKVVNFGISNLGIFIPSSHSNQNPWSSEGLLRPAHKRWIDCPLHFRYNSGFLGLKIREMYTPEK